MLEALGSVNGKEEAWTQRDDEGQTYDVLHLFHDRLDSFCVQTSYFVMKRKGIILNHIIVGVSCGLHNQHFKSIGLKGTSPEPYRIGYILEEQKRIWRYNRHKPDGKA